MVVKSGLVFISCGQSNQDEIDLGRGVAELVDRLTPFEGYFAQNQSNLDGVSENILGALERCVRLIAIMHHRGIFNTPDGDRVRASVWIEQEIAVAAYIRQILKRPLEVRLYVKKGISLEGMREKLQLNPTFFESNDEVIADLKRVLAQWQSVPALHLTRSGCITQFQLNGISNLAGLCNAL